MASAEIPARLALPEADEVHVWSGRVSESAADLPVLAGFLAAEEQERAARFFRTGDRASFLVAHGILRRILGAYLGVDPALVLFAVNPFGKPSLHPGMGAPALAFNLAHSGDLVLIAVAKGRRVGIDVEQVRENLDVTELARTQFSPQESAALLELAPAERTEAFFRCWTRKEAYVKARGEGLSLPLSRFAVAFGPAEPPSVLWAADDIAAPGRWTVFDLAPAAGYAAALVIDRPPIRFVVKHWTAAPW